MKAYQKMFEIELNQKKFAIFLAEHNRCAFLEVDENGEYRYPTYEDFKILNKVYNNHNPYILYDIPRFSFEEKVRYGVLGVVSVAVLLNTGYKIGKQPVSFKEEKNDTEIVLIEESEPNSQENSSQVYVSENFHINSIDDLNGALGYLSITPEEVHKTIDENINMPEEYKIYSHMLIDAITINYPNADLRIYYENAKDKKINLTTVKELENMYKLAACGANYVAETNTLNIPDNTYFYTKLHEDAHTLTSFNQERYGRRIIRACYLGTSLDEAMTNKIVNLLTNTLSYKQEEAVLDFLCSCVEFNIEDYINYGIPYLIDQIQMKYPGIDINYIVATLDKLKNTLIEFKVRIPLDSSVSLLDELFEMCKMSAYDYVNPYTAFTQFAKVLEFANNKALFYTYLDKFNEYLLSTGYSEIITSEEVKNKWKSIESFSGFFQTEDAVYPCQYKERTSDIETMTNRQDIDELVGIYTPYNRSETLLYSLPENYSIFGTNEYWLKMVKENKIINKEELEPVTFYYNGQELASKMLRKLFVCIGKTNDGKIGFVIRNIEGEEIYGNSKELNYISNGVNLEFYLPDLTNIDKLELRTYLSEEYLKFFLQSQPQVFRNLKIEDDTIIIEPNYKINVVLKDQTTKQISAYEGFQISNSKISLTSLGIDFPFENADNSDITLKEILKYYNFLDPNIEEYTVNEEDLKSIITNYFNEVNVKKAR